MKSRLGICWDWKLMLIIAFPGFYNRSFLSNVRKDLKCFLEYCRIPVISLKGFVMLHMIASISILLDFRRLILWNMFCKFSLILKELKVVPTFQRSKTPSAEIWTIFVSIIFRRKLGSWIGNCLNSYYLWIGTLTHFQPMFLFYTFWICQVVKK